MNPDGDSHAYEMPTIFQTAHEDNDFKSNATPETDRDLPACVAVMASVILGESGSKDILFD